MSLPTLRLICFTQAGAQTAQRLLRAIDSQFCCEGVLSSRFAGSSCLPKTELSLALARRLRRETEMGMAKISFLVVCVLRDRRVFLCGSLCLST